MKPLVWLGTSRADLKRFPAKPRRIAGFQLWRVQLGLEPNDWRPMRSVGTGVEEIRVHTGIDVRVLYVAKFWEGVYVLHAFEKKTRRTTSQDLELAKERFRLLVAERRKREG